MIQAMILDVDGVLVGGKKGFNWPDPHPEVLRILSQLRKNGFLVSLCTGKGTFSIKRIVEKARLDNVHIGDGGAVIIDFMHGKVIAQHGIDRAIALKALELFLAHNIYVELYTRDGYYVQKSFLGDKTIKHTAILDKKPEVTTSLPEVSRSLEIIKIMPIADDDRGKEQITELVRRHLPELSLQWGIHPTALPYQFGILTAQGISKRAAVEVISKQENIPLGDMLGIGDGTTDWQFMEICGYAGAMGNASEDLKEKVASREKGGYIGSSVDDNGVLDILQHFRVLESRST